MTDLSSFEENKTVTDKISDILSGRKAPKNKARSLKELRANAVSPLARQHIEYYIERINKQRRDLVKKAVLAVCSAAYLLFTLCRIYWYYKPNQNPFTDTAFTISDLIVLLYIALIIAAVVYIIKENIFRNSEK